MASPGNLDSTLAAHLSAMDPEQLTRLIAGRPECGLPPQPDSLAALAARLLSPYGPGPALIGLTLPQVQVAEALAALGDGCTPAELAGLLGVTVDDPALREALHRLAEFAIAWPDGGRLRTAGLDQTWPHPLNLGPPAAHLLELRNMDELRRMARELDISAGRGKTALVADLVAWFGDGDNVRRRIAAAPEATRTLLEKLAAEGPSVLDPAAWWHRDPTSPARWALDHGLLLPSGWGQAVTMSREVALALRGRDYHAPFEPVSPVVGTVPVKADAVRREAAAAATAAVADLTVLVDACGTTPVAVLKTGGVGVRELRRLAKATGQTEDRVRLWLEIAATGGLIAMTEAGLVPTAAFDEFAATEPALQLIELLDAWLDLGSCPLQRPESGAAPPAFAADPYGPAIPDVRDALLRTVLALPAGEAVADPAALADLLDWRRPALTSGTDELARLVDGVWREGHQVGLLAHGAPTELARLLLDEHADNQDEIEAAARTMVPSALTCAVLQADLTAVVTGVPASALTVLLDLAADQESRSGAWTWRFSASSVRRALDAGLDADDLLNRLTAAAAGGRVPQPLSYLIGDVARRYGRVQVRPVGCCLRSDDTVLLTELLRARGLAKLRLTELAPTVLASALPSTETLAALRAAGYAPTGENPDGTRAIELMSRHRAVPAPSSSSFADDGDDSEWDDDPLPLFDGEFLSPAELAGRLTAQR